MGRPKLLLRLGGQTVISRVLTVLNPVVTRTVVVCRRDDDDLRLAAEAEGATIVQPPVDPPDMRASVEHALRWLIGHDAPTSDSAWLLLPADHPLVEPAVLQSLLEASARQPESIVVPTHGGLRGHPTVLPWSLVPEVFVLPHTEGLNQLVRRKPERIVEVPVASATVLADLDTPEDYDRWQQVIQ